MADSNQVRLRQQFVANYDNLIRSLTRRLGSSEFAYEALHETFLRIERVPASTEVHSPADYIFRTAINVAKNRKKAQSYRVSAAEIDALIDLCDEAPDPARVVEARSEIEAFERAMAKLPDRACTVMRLMSLEGKTIQETAEVLGISVRTVAADLQMAMKHCAASLDRTLVPRLGGPRPRS